MIRQPSDTYVRKVRSKDTVGRRKILERMSEIDEIMLTKFVSEVVDASDQVGQALVNDIAQIERENVRRSLIQSIVGLSVGGVVNLGSCPNTPNSDNNNNKNDKNELSAVPRQTVACCVRILTAALREPARNLGSEAALLVDAAFGLRNLASRSQSSEIESMVPDSEEIALRAFSWLSLIVDISLNNMPIAINTDSEPDAEQALLETLTVVTRSPRFQNNANLEASLKFLFEALRYSELESLNLDMVNFLFANLTSRSHSRLFCICILFSEYQGSQFVSELKTRTESAIKQLDRIETLFGLAAIFVIEKASRTLSFKQGNLPQPPEQQQSTREFYHSWLNKIIASANRRTHQFLVSLFQETYTNFPLDFIIANVLAIRNHPPFKTLLTEIKSHLAEATVSDIGNEQKLVNAGLMVANEKRPTFGKFMQEFLSTGQVPKSLYMEILVNDAWYKTQFLPKLIKRGNEADDIFWKAQQNLFDILRKAGRVPSSFLASLPELRRPPSSSSQQSRLSLADFSAIENRLETCLHVFIELEEPSAENNNADGETFEQDCISSIASLFRSIEALQKIPSEFLSNQHKQKAASIFSVDILSGDLQVSGSVFLCSKSIIAIADCILAAFAKAKSFSNVMECRLSEIMRLFVTEMPTCVAALVLRVYSIIYGAIDGLNRRQCLVIARVLYHLIILLPDEYFGDSFGEEETDGNLVGVGGKNKLPTGITGARNRIMHPFFWKYMIVECLEHVDLIMQTYARILQSKTQSQRQAIDGALNNAENTANTLSVPEQRFFEKKPRFNTASMLLDRYREISERKNFLSSSLATDFVARPNYLTSGGTLNVYNWTVWELSCGTKFGAVFQRTRYIRGKINGFLNDLSCVDEKNQNIGSLRVCAEILRAICKYASFTAAQLGSQFFDISESIMCLEVVLNEVLNRIEKSPVLPLIKGRMQVLFGFLEHEHFGVFFNLFSVIPVSVLWNFAGTQAEIPNFDTDIAKFWEEKFLLAVGFVSWDILIHAAGVVFNALNFTNQQEFCIQVCDN
ncbi:hypothetical protein HK100_003005 [Physocladia obscura]|uniref:Uncharacterized protein n=1 Tax=Physocladia obscura TaxID=109957 RepID=A0AAD5XF00_9FUNG|nr:hypothetical protein HK100_003005 [Physocladia obscura]